MLWCEKNGCEKYSYRHKMQWVLYCVFEGIHTFLRDHFQNEKKESEESESKTNRSLHDHHSHRCYKVAVSVRKCVPHN